MIGQRNLFSIGLAAAFGLVCNGLWAAEPNSTLTPSRSLSLTPSESVMAPTPNPAAAPAARIDPQPAPLNPVAQSAARSGVQACLKRIDQVTSFIGRGAQANAFLFPAPSDADRRLLAMSLEADSSNTQSYAGATFAPVGIDACDAEYEAVTYMPMNCRDTAARNFAQLKPVGAVKRSIEMLDGGPNMRIFLMPAGQGCVVIKKEVAY